MTESKRIDDSVDTEIEAAYERGYEAGKDKARRDVIAKVQDNLDGIHDFRSCGCAECMIILRVLKALYVRYYFGVVEVEANGLQEGA